MDGDNLREKSFETFYRDNYSDQLSLAGSMSNGPGDSAEERLARALELIQKQKEDIEQEREFYEQEIRDRDQILKRKEADMNAAMEHLSTEAQARGNQATASSSRESNELTRVLSTLSENLAARQDTLMPYFPPIPEAIHEFQGNE